MKNIKIRSLIIVIILLLGILFFIRLKSKNDISNESLKNISFVRGTDISRYQGDVDFSKLYDQSIRFAFIKATEGTDYQDPKFLENWENAKKTKMKVGAYHFFRFELSAKKQAENFIKNVTLEDGDLPPVIDLEYYGEYINKPAKTQDVKEELRVMIDAFKKHYNKKPIIYCNSFVYERYLEKDFSDVDIWYRSIGTGFPELSDKRKWTFWQYDDKASLEGSSGAGASKYFDLNYFYGGMDELEEYGRTNKK